jgi:hypothetical protein
MKGTTFMMAQKHLASEAPPVIQRAFACLREWGAITGGRRFAALPAGNGRWHTDWAERRSFQGQRWTQRRSSQRISQRP